MVSLRGVDSRKGFGGGKPSILLLTLWVLSHWGSGEVPTAWAQTSLGGQRVATSSGTFLKIGTDARGAALAGTYNALVEGPAALFSNPAGLIGRSEEPGVSLSYVQWPADVHVGAFSFARSFPPLGGRMAIGFLYLGTELNETTEFHPLGTGRTVSYSDFVAAASLARSFTDRLAIGITVKYLREDGGSNLGGPLTSGWLLDAGTVYSLGYRNSRLAITLAHFGPDLEPQGSFQSRVLGTTVDYTAFSPPTQFQLGFAIDPWMAGQHRLTVAGQVLHQADNEETLRSGLEYWFQENYALRGGYDFSSDEMGLSAGIGIRLPIGGRRGTLDYAFTEGGHLAVVHRWSLGFVL